MTKSQINKLGKQIRQLLREDKKPTEDLLISLQKYRTSYREDLASVFESISGIAKNNRKDNIISFRIKRIESILSKIKRQPTMSLGNMGDIAGCRILVYNSESLPNLIKEIENRFTVTKVNNYLIDNNSVLNVFTNASSSAI